MSPFQSSPCVGIGRPLGRTLFALAICGLAAAPLGAAAWRPIGPGGGYINARPIVSPAAPKTAYVTGQNRTGIFRTEDGGQTWSRLEIRSALQASEILGIDPNNAQSLLGRGIVSEHDRPIVSFDGGAHWRSASEGLPLDGNGHVDLYGGVVFDPAVTGHLVAGTFNGLYESRDGGAHWAPAGFANEIIIALGAARPNELWVAVLGGDDDHPIFEIRESRDGGALWTSAGWPAHSPFNFVTFRFDARNPEQPYFVDYDGRLFHRTATGWNRLRPSQRTFDVAVLADGTIVAATDRGARSSRDGGRTWTGGGRPSLSSLVTVGPREILAIGEYGAWRSADDGEHFAAASRGLYAQAIDTLAAAADGTLWAGIQGPGFMRTRNGGGDWTRQIRGLGIDPKAYPPIPNDFAASPSQPQELYAVLGTGRGPDLARSRDGGDHWAYATFPATAAGHSNIRLAVDARDADRILWASTAGNGPLISYVWRSDDGGRGWGAPFHFREHEFILDFALDPVDPETAYALSTDGLWTSHDGGRSFRRGSRGLPAALTNGYTLTIDPERHQDVYVAAAVGIYRSRDGGATFHRLGPALPAAGQRGIAIASGGRVLIGSIEQGVQLWHPETGRFESVGTGLPLDAFTSQIVVDPRERRTVYAATFERSVWRLDLDE
ncbi:MAG TPA: hypothetical protein VGS22_11230 [Thermoanaerobaculia bacterium]|nr:hypothetical protein [Thermoanaerobaculia bacterium]